MTLLTPYTRVRILTPGYRHHVADVANTVSEGGLTLYVVRLFKPDAVDLVTLPESEWVRHRWNTIGRFKCGKTPIPKVAYTVRKFTRSQLEPFTD